MNKIIGLTGSIPKNEWSHNAAYNKIWGRILNVDVQMGDADYSGVDTAYVCMDINYSGGLNLFGGANEQLYNRLKEFCDFRAKGGKAVMLDHSIPDLGKMLEGRLDNKTTFEGFDMNFLQHLSAQCSKVETITMPEVAEKEIVIGDSHSLSMAKEGVPVIRLDAKTLHGAIEEKDFILNLIPDGVEKVTLVFGSIDIRHHVLRFDYPVGIVRDLYTRYMKTCRDIILQKKVRVELATPLPVESENRKMAKTTMYKGTPFYGSRNDRVDMTNLARETLKEMAVGEVVEYPSEWYDMPGEKFETEIMERPQGVHIGYPNYRMNNFGKQTTALF